MSVDVTIRGVSDRYPEGDCPCPGRPHTEEHVYLMAEPSLPLAIYAFKMFANAGRTILAKEAALVSAYIPRAITGWTFVDRDGDVVPVTEENAERLIPWERGGHAVLEEANRLYTNRVLAPFYPWLTVEQIYPPTQTPSLLPTGPKDESTSATPAPSSSLPERSRRSSRTSSDG